MDECPCQHDNVQADGASPLRRAVKVHWDEDTTASVAREIRTDGIEGSLDRLDYAIDSLDTDLGSLFDLLNPVRRSLPTEGTLDADVATSSQSRVAMRVNAAIGRVESISRSVNQVYREIDS